MDIALLRAFVTVARSGSVHRAAAELHLSQASVSRQLQRLEIDLGTELFARQDGRALELTPAGRRLLSESEELLSEVGRRWALLRARATGDRRLAVAIGSMMLQLDEMGPLLQAYRDAQRDVHLHLVEHHDFGDAIGQLDAGEVDVAFSGIDVQQVRPPLDAHLLWALGPRVTLRRDHPLAGREELTLDDLAQLPLAVIEGSISVEQLLANCAAAGIALDIRQRSSQVSTLAAAVLGGDLASVAYGVDRRDVPPPYDAIVSIPLDMPAPDYRLAVFWHDGRPLTRAAQDFIAHVRDAHERAPALG
jgi:DNA-binding transcriptional LysR family regulator